MDIELNYNIKKGEGFHLEFKESFSKDIGKEICAFANANGGKILIGVTDFGKIKGVQATNRLKSQIVDLARKLDPHFFVEVEMVENVLVVDVPEGKNKPYSVNGRFYVRQGPNSQQLSRDEVKEFFHSLGLIHWDEKINEEFKFDEDFNQGKFTEFLTMTGLKSLSKTEVILKNLELLQDNKIKNAGVLLFCSKITKFFRNATISCVLFLGKDKYKILDQHEFEEDLNSNYEETLEYVKSKLNTEYIIKGGPREEKLELPEDALREAILNSIAHRDYFSPAHIQVNIFNDRIEIVNPGGLIGDLTVADLYENSVPRNRLLFWVMQRMDLVEKAGSGLVRIEKAMKDYKLHKPLIEANKSWFKVTLLRPDLQIESYQQRFEGPRKVLERVLGTITPNQRKIVETMIDNPYITSKELAVIIGISDRKVRENIRKLKERKVIKRVGPDRGGHWEIN